MPRTAISTNIALVLSVCARDGFRPFLLGDTPDVLHRAADVIVAHFPSIQIAGLRDGYFRPEQEAQVVEQISGSKQTFASTDRRGICRRHHGRYGIAEC